jgi:hypothetical protein
MTATLAAIGDFNGLAVAIFAVVLASCGRSGSSASSPRW